jgi:hypothetical protein
MGKNPKLVTQHRIRAKRRFSRVKYYSTPLREVLRIVERQIGSKVEDAKSITDFKRRLIEICNDANFWKQIEQLHKNVEQLKISIDEIGL